MKLSDELKFWRAERPDEWIMDDFIRKAKELESNQRNLLVALQAALSVFDCKQKKKWTKVFTYGIEAISKTKGAKP